MSFSDVATSTETPICNRLSKHSPFFFVTPVTHSLLSSFGPLSRRGATLPWALEHAKPGRLRKLPLSVTEVVYTTKVVYLPVLINPGSQFDSFKSRIPVKYKQCLRTATRGDRRRSYLHVHVLPYLVDEKFDGATSINFPERGSMVPLSTLVSLKKKGLRVSKGPCR